MQLKKYVFMFLGVLVYCNLTSLFVSLFLFLTIEISTILSFNTMMLKNFFLAMAPVLLLFLFGKIFAAMGLPSPFSPTGAIAFGKKMQNVGGAAAGGASMVGQSAKQGVTGKGFGQRFAKQLEPKGPKYLAGKNLATQKDLKKERLKQERKNFGKKKEKITPQDKKAYKKAKRDYNKARGKYRPLQRLRSYNRRFNPFKDIQAIQTRDMAKRRLDNIKYGDLKNMYAEKTKKIRGGKSPFGSAVTDKMKSIYYEKRHNINNKMPVLGKALNRQIDKKQMYLKKKMSNSAKFHENIQQKRREKYAEKYA